MTEEYFYLIYTIRIAQLYVNTVRYSYTINFLIYLNINDTLHCCIKECRSENTMLHEIECRYITFSTFPACLYDLLSQCLRMLLKTQYVSFLFTLS